MKKKLKTTVLVGALLTGVTTSVNAAPALAARPPLVDLRGAGVGAYTLDAGGTARLNGAVTGAPFDGTYRATLSSTDGSLPAAGTCERATASLDVAGSRSRTLQLAATGEVCGTWAEAAYVVTHRFVGRYVVTDASVRKARGTDGWISLILATEGRANVEAIDT
ncbi:MAG TPA: hypothetical protein VER39_06055 [Nocardioidaceae bacterium]|nr:hypothetical protein [Nocardioidaceae bacterium]